MNFGNDFTFDTFSNTLSLTTTPQEAIAEIETNGLVTSSVNTSSINVDGFATFDVVGISLGLNSLVGNINTINSSGSANISVGNFSTINASNIVGYQETLIAGNNISIVGNTISSTGGGALPAVANFSSVNTSTLNASTINTTGDVSIGGVITAPNQPCFRAYPSESVVISSGSSFPSLPFDVIDIDNASGYNISTYEYTIPVAGNWMFYWSCGVAAGKNFVTSVRKNNIIYDRSVLGSTQALRDFDTLTGKGLSVISCAVGDVMNVTVNGGAQGASVAAGTGGNQFNSFGGFLIG